MQTADQWDAANNDSQSFSVALGKLLAVGVILAPLVMLMFPELNHRLGTTSHGPQDAPAKQRLTPTPSLIPDSFHRSDE